MYKIGRVYKIYFNKNIYIGSTFKTLNERFNRHKYDYKCWLNKKRNDKCEIYPYFLQFGIENFKIELIKEYEVCDKYHLQAYEQLWINKLDCVNKNSSFKIKKLSDKEYCKKNKERIKQYREDNKERIKQYQKQYREDNKERIKEHQKQFYQDNKEQVLEQRKQYREINKERIKQYQKQYDKIKYEKNKTRFCDCPKCFKTINMNNYYKHIQKCDNYLFNQTHIDFL